MNRDPDNNMSAAPGGVADLAPADPREHIEPNEAQRPMSLWYVTLLCLFFAWAGYYTQRYSADYGALSYDENAGFGGAKTNIVKQVDPYVLGKRLFENVCAKCHQPDGQGVAGQYPPLVGSEWVLASGPARMIRIALDGLQGPITVKGVGYNNNMTPHRDALNDQQIAAILTYVRREWDHGCAPVTPETVKQIRQDTEKREDAWTVIELLKVQ